MRAPWTEPRHGQMRSSPLRCGSKRGGAAGPPPRCSPLGSPNQLFHPGPPTRGPQPDALTGCSRRLGSRFPWPCSVVAASGTPRAARARGCYGSCGQVCHVLVPSPLLPSPLLPSPPFPTPQLLSVLGKRRGTHGEVPAAEAVAISSANHGRNISSTPTDKRPAHLRSSRPSKLREARDTIPMVPTQKSPRGQEDPTPLGPGTDGRTG